MCKFHPKKETWRIENKINFIYPQKISMQYRLYSIWWGGEKAINEIVKLATIVEKVRPSMII